MKILLCDDHPIVTSGLRDILQEQPGIQVIEMVHAHQHIAQAIQQLFPDILFLDLNMNGENTLDAIGSFKSIRPAMAIIIFTSYNIPALVKQALEAGASAYLLKSSATSEILQSIAEVQKNQTYIGAEVKRHKQIFSNPIHSMDQFNARQQLTLREQAVFDLVAQGKTEAEIAETLYLSKHTVHTHRKNIMAKLGLHSSADFIRLTLHSPPQ